METKLTIFQAEWGYVYKGEILISAVDEDGRNQVDKLGVGDIWYFPKGEAHVVQGLAPENEYLLAFDDGDFDAVGTTFMVDDWITHTPKSILAKNFGMLPITACTNECRLLNADVVQRSRSISICWCAEPESLHFEGYTK